MIKVFENLEPKDLLNAGLVCRRWCEITQFYKFNKKFQLHFECCTFADNCYPIKKFLKCSRFFPNLKFTNVKFVPQNDYFWSIYGDVIESLNFNSCSIMKSDLFKIFRCAQFLKSLTIVRCDDLFKSWNLIKKVKQLNLDLPYLKEITIQETSLLSKTVMDIIFLMAPNLTSINLSNCLETTSSRDRVLILDTLIEYISTRPAKIKVLNLLNTPIDDMFLERLAGIENLILRELRLTFNGTIGADNKSGLISLLRKQPNLEILDLTDSRGLTNMCVMEVCKNIKNLKQLILNKCWMINDAAVKEVNRLQNLEVIMIIM